MSNYLSTPVKYAAPPTDDNFELLSKVALAQQQKYDVNHQKIQTILDQFGAQKLLRPEDNEYLANQLSSITNKLNNSSGNLASQGLTDSLIGQVKMVAQDPFILNAFEQTAKMNKYQAELAQIREKKPELYNDINNAFALNQAGYEDYINGKSFKMGTLSYIPYIDVTKTTLEKVKQLKELRGDQVIEREDPNNPGRLIKRTIKGLTENEIFQYFPDLLTSQERQQLGINGWYNYKDNMNEARTEFESYINKHSELIDADIRHAESVKNNSLNSDDKINEAKEKLKNLNEQKDRLTSLQKDIDINSATQLGGFLYSEKFKNSLASMAKANISEEYESDKYYFDSANLEISRRKLELEEKKAGIVNVVNAVSFSPKEGETAQKINPLKQYKNDYNTIYNNMNSLAVEAYNSDRVTPEMKAQFKEEMNKLGYDENGNIIDKNKASKTSKASAFKLAFSESNMGVVLPEISKKLAGLEVKRKNLIGEFGHIEQSSLIETFKKDPDKYVTDIFEKMKFIGAQNENQIDKKAIDDFYFKITGKHLTGSQMMDVKSNFSTSFFGFLSDKTVINEIKNALLKDPNKLRLLDSYVEYKGGKEDKQGDYNYGFLTSTLVADSKELTNKRIMENTKNRRNIYFNTGEIGTITDENLRKKIVDMIPQDANTALFNSKNPISFYKNPDNTITIKQNKGYSTGKDSNKLRDAEITVDSEDALYKELMNYVDLNDAQRGLSAQRSKTIITPNNTPSFVRDGNELVMERVDYQMTQLPRQMLGALFMTPPSNYLTKTRTEDIYKRVLKDTVSEDKIETFVNKLSSNLSKFKVTLKPFDNTWAIDIKKPNGEILKTGSTGMTYLEDDLTNVVENYPQTLIVDWILRRLVNNPKEIDTLL